MTGHFHIGAHGYEAPALAAGLYITATPIGNLGDITIRALQALAGCSLIYCEDTRVTAKLLDRYGIRKTLRPYHDHNAQKAGEDIVAAIASGQAVVLVSDAGMPLISDPGYGLVQACAQAQLAVTSIPGASASLMALQLSGLPADKFAFLGFLPEKKAQRIKALESIKRLPMTTIFYESPHRILAALDDISSVLNDRPMALARELTKLHEEVLRGTASLIHAALAARESIKGEIAIVIAPSPNEPIADDNAIDGLIDTALETMSASKAAAHVSKLSNLSRDDIYQRILKRKSDG